MKTAQPALLDIFERLSASYGPMQWWPADSPFEVCVGAILTQNTNWGNVEKALANLKSANSLDPVSISTMPQAALAELIRPAGYYNLKSVRLKALVSFIMDLGGLEQLFQQPWQQLRQSLLEVNGVGPETADSILLYAGHKPSFVVDAYTRRIFSRLGLVDQKVSYELLRSLFMGQLPQDATLFNEYHALIVQLGKDHCRPKPVCSDCCLVGVCGKNF